MNEMTVFGNTPVTMNIFNPDDLADPDRVLTGITILLTSALRGLVDAEDSNRQDRFDRFCAADQVAMTCAHVLMEGHYAKSVVIQNLRLAITLASFGHSPNEIKLSRSKRNACGSKTYIARNPDSGLLKIGRSINPDARMAGLQTGAAAQPELLFVIDADVESELHKRFSPLRVFGEWFRDDGTITAFIAEQKSEKRDRGEVV